MTQTLPSWATYGKYHSNYGTHTLKFSLGGPRALDVYFSYQTPVAFRAPGSGLVVRENDWGVTTGKHLNWIDGGGASRPKRIPGPQFEELLAAVCARKAVTL